MKHTANEFAKGMMSQEPKSLSAASTDGVVVDCLGFREALVVLLAGVAAASAEADVTVRESAASDGSGSAAISGAAFAQVTVSNDQDVYVGRIDLTKRLRYLFTRNVGDGSNAALIATAIILMDPQDAPASQKNTLAFSV